MKRIPLYAMAHARSGDKGDGSNVGVLAYDDRGYEILREWLTPDRVRAHFAGIVQGEVERYELKAYFQELEDRRNSFSGVELSRESSIATTQMKDQPAPEVGHIEGRFWCLYGCRFGSVQDACTYQQYGDPRGRPKS